MIKLVIFDFDGVIIDSHGVINNLFTSLLDKELGLDLEVEEFARFPGMRFEERAEILAKKHGKDIPQKKILEIIEKGRYEYYTNASDYTAMYPGTLEFLRRLKNSGIKIAIGSNGSRRTIEKLLKKFKIFQMFDNIVTYDDVAHGKPAPDMFILSMERFRLSPEECVVIDDSAEGIRAARQAGMRSIGMLTTSTVDELEGADMFVSSFSEIDLRRL